MHPGYAHGSEHITFIFQRFDQSGVFNIGANYRDVCEGSCMSQLSFQVLILMLTKPLPKFLSDVMIP